MSASAFLVPCAGLALTLLAQEDLLVVKILPGAVFHGAGLSALKALDLTLGRLRDLS
jgi:hypothetical protein